MSDTGSLEFLVAKVKSIERVLTDAQDKRLDAFTALLSSIETGVADLIDNLEGGGGAAAIEAMTKALGALKMPEVNYTAPAFNPTINVPAPAPMPPVNLSAESVAALASALAGMTVSVEATMPQGEAPTTVINAPRIKNWRIAIPGQYGAPPREMIITPNYSED